MLANTGGATVMFEVAAGTAAAESCPAQIRASCIGAFESTQQDLLEAETETGDSST
jgi:hypothetical protein